MSVYSDHLVIKPKIETYKEIFNYFKNLIPEEIFVYGSDLDGEHPWSGFFVYFENGFFVEFQNPDICLDSKKVGLSFTCQKEFRENFLAVVKEGISGRIKEISIPSAEPMVDILAVDEGKTFSTWASVYSDDWYKNWGSQISKFGLLSPFCKINNITISSESSLKDDAVLNFSWIDPSLPSGSLISLPITGSQCDFSLQYLDNIKGVEVLVDFEVEDLVSKNFATENFEFSVDDNRGRMRVRL